MIKITCHTNLDAYIREEWPDTLQIKPDIGERIASSRGRSLKIVNITHYEKYLLIELHF